MNYNLLNDMGLGNLDLTYLFIGTFAAIIVLLIIVIVLSVNLSRLSKRYKKIHGRQERQESGKGYYGAL